MIRIYPQKLQGTVRVPGSKSMGHRALICAALAQGNSQLTGLTRSDDIDATMQGLCALGAHVENACIQGIHVCEDFPTIDCMESGSTLRFLLPVALTVGEGAHFVGHGNLAKRPLAPYAAICKKQGIFYQQAPGDLLKLTVRGKLRPDRFCLPGNISSQFITGLLLALPLLREDSEIRLTTPLESADYVAMTIQAMQAFGVSIEQTAQGFYVPGNQNYRPCRFEVEGDYSQAAFFLSANALGSRVTVEGLRTDSLQGDRVIMKMLQTLEGQEVILDGSQCPDIVPILALVAALRPGMITQIVHAERLRMKECDRLDAVTQELTKLGADISQRHDGLFIRGVEQLTGGRVWSHNDHRIAMMLAIAATCCRNPVLLEDPACVAKSYPQFYKDYQMLGGSIEEESYGCNLR